MARIRYIKPEFFFDEHTAELPFSYRIAFIGLWCHADKNGCLEDSPKTLKAKIFPYDEIDMDKVLARLAQDKKPFILRYTISGKRYIKILNFLKHQKPHHTEKHGEIPLPEPVSVNSPLSNGSLTVKPPLSNRSLTGGNGKGNGKGNGEGNGKGNGKGNGECDRLNTVSTTLPSQSGRTDTTPIKDTTPHNKPNNTPNMSQGDDNFRNRVVALYRDSLNIPTEQATDWEMTYKDSNDQGVKDLLMAFYGDKEFALQYADKKIAKLKEWARQKKGRAYSLKLVAMNAYADRGVYSEWRAQREKVAHGEVRGSRPDAGGLSAMGDFIGGFLKKINPEGGVK